MRHPFHFENKRKRRSTILETPSTDREFSAAQVETPDQGNETLPNFGTVVQESLGGAETRPQLVESSQISNDIQVCTENVEQKTNNRIMKMRKEMENKLDAVLKGMRTNRSASTIRNPRSEMNGIQNCQPSGSKNDRCNEVHASNVENSDTENEGDHPLRAPNMRELKNPARPFN